MSIPVTETRHSLFLKHEGTLQEAISAVHTRIFYAKYPEPPSPKIYGETAHEEGQKAYEGKLGERFAGLIQESDSWLEGVEESPYTRAKLGIKYPVSTDLNAYFTRAKAAGKAWAKADVYTRAGILTESLDRIRNRFFELAYATMHTTGQSFVMSFQASGPHANDRALEAIALGLHEQTRFPQSVEWVKPMGKMEVKLAKRFLPVPLGVSLAIGCSTFPVWNTVPGLYASLITGNTALVKPHPGAIYPLALVVEEIQLALKENGFDPHIVQLCADSPNSPITKVLAEHPATKIIDYTGGSAFGNYIESLSGKRTFTEKAGINSVVFHSCADLNASMQNLAFSLALYSGQMCTCPQNIFIPRSGIVAGGQTLSYDDTVKALTDAIRGLVTHEKMGPGTLGAIQNEMTYARVGEAQKMGYKVLLESISVSNPEFPQARIATPVVMEVPSDKVDVFSKEMFGPIVMVVPVEDGKAGTALAKQIAAEHGAITFSAWCTDTDMQDYMVEEMAEVFTSISFNFTGPIWVNQSAGFSDFHVTGGNPAGNASLTDPEYVIRRFEIVGVRTCL